MQPLIVLVAVFVVLVLPFGWWNALRTALAAMFFLTASGHWGRRRKDLIRMVPSVFPRPAVLVTLTGLCEIAGAIGLLIPRTARASGIGLALLLLAIFPANVRAAREEIAIAGRPATPLPLRTVIQIIFLVATVAVVVGAKIKGQFDLALP